MRDAFDLGRVEGIELPSALALLLRANLLGTRERPFERGLDPGPALVAVERNERPVLSAPSALD